jgi:hypothetical protein
MPQNTTINLVAGTWTQLTDADTTAITFQVYSTAPVFIRGTVDETAPTTTAGAFAYSSYQGERDATLAGLFPGVAGAKRVWAFCPASGASVAFSHA